MSENKTVRVRPDGFGGWIVEVFEEGNVGLILLVIALVLVFGVFWGLYELWQTKIGKIIILSVLGIIILASILHELIRPVVDPFYKQPLSYVLSDDGSYYSVSGISDSDITELEIPATIDGKPITHICDSAFKDCKSITSITISKGVTSIGDSAFKGCDSLKSVVIPNSITSIGDSAFENCFALTSVVIPNSVTSIGESAFDGCTSLTSLVIPDGVTSIDTCAFAFCHALTSITIPTSVNNIGENAIEYCNALTTINYGGTIEQWDAIEKVENRWNIYGILDWDYNTGDYTIHCTDGSIKK